MSGSTRWLVIVGVVVALAVVGSIAVSVTADHGPDYAEGTPERAVQDYLRAVADRDATRALAFFSTALSDRCASVSRESITRRGDSGFRATLDRTSQRDGRTIIDVSLTEVYGSGPFGRSESTQSLVFELVQENGVWRLSEAPWPFYCPTEKIVPVPAR